MIVASPLKLPAGDTAASPSDGLAERLKLRPYQQDMVSGVYRNIKAGYLRILLVVIMGSGKTYAAAWILKDAALCGHRSVFLVALNVLLEQTAASLRNLGLNATILQGGRAVDPNADVIVASCQTISARLRRGVSLEEMLGNPKVIICDEAHNTAFLSVYTEIEQHYLKQGTIFIGLTATPWRLSKKEWLGQRYDALVCGPQPPEIIEIGGALPCRGYTLTGALDLDTLHVRGGEYIDGEISSQATKPEALKHVVKEWQRLCKGRPTLMVGATVEQAHATKQAFTDAGITAETVVGSNAQVERLAIFGNLKRHGNPMGWQVYSIDAPIEEDKAPPTKTCPECAAEVTVFARVCPQCGYEFSGKQLEDEQQDLVLQQLNEFVDKFTRKKIKALRRWRKEAYQRDLSPDEPINRFVSEFGHTPPVEWMLHAALGQRVSQKRKLAYAEYLERHCQPGRWADQWFSYQLQLEFGVSDLAQLGIWRLWNETLDVPYTANFEDVKRVYIDKIKDLPDDHPDQEPLALAFDDARLELAAGDEEVSA